MTLYRKAVAALIAAFILLSSILVQAEGAVAPYDMNAPQDLQPGHLYAKSALLIDEDSGETLFTKDSKVRMYPASTTKIMTLLLGIESDIPMEQEVTIPAEAADIMEGSSVIPVKPGDVISWKDLLYSFMLSSGNDGANAIAVLSAGGIPAFVERMNARAEELGMVGTHYANAHGLHDPEHFTTAQDLAVLARAAMQNDVFRDIVAQPNWTITVTRGGETKTAEIISRNSLLQKDEKYYYPDCTGIKTGHHNKAGWCFVGSAERDGMRLICVVLDCEGEFDKWYDAARLFEYGFTRYEDVSAAALMERAAGAFNAVQIDGAAPGEETLSLSLSNMEGGDATVKVVSGSDASMALKASQLAESAQVEWTRALSAPVSANEIMGNVRCTLQDGREVRALRVASRDVAAAPTAEPEPTVAPTPEQAEVTVAPEAAPEPVPERKGGAGMFILALLVLLALLAGSTAYALHDARRRRRRRRKRRGGGARRPTKAAPKR